MPSAQRSEDAVSEVWIASHFQHMRKKLPPDTR